MRAYVCTRCRELVAFESQACRACGAVLGFDPATATVEALQPAAGGLAALDDPGGNAFWARCSRSDLTGCNWLVPVEGKGGPCLSCSLTANLPTAGDDEYRQAFAKAEMAKRRLVYQLLGLGLPVKGKAEEPTGGLSFELVASDRHVVTGHDKGLITLDLNETDDSFREQTRAQFGEPYRTILGHFRHEVGHYYWSRLLAQDGPLDGCRRRELLVEARGLFGDDRHGYDEALGAHYSSGPVPQWEGAYVSAYAAMHPLEDWAETFAHFLHIWDAVQTAASFGVLVVGPVDDRTGRRDPAKASVPSEETASLEGFDAVIADWAPLTGALNALNRSLGKDDLYPFELQPTVIGKLAFVHRVITAAGRRTAET